MHAVRKGNSRNPDAAVMFDFVDVHFLNAESHEEAVAIVEGWKPQPWKGQIWKGAGKDNTNRVWSGTAWLPGDTPHSASGDPGAVYFNFPAPGMSEVTAGCEVTKRGVKRAKAILIPPGVGEYTAPVKKPKTLFGAAKLQAAKELNAACVLAEKDPVGHEESFMRKLSAYVRGTRSNAIYLEFSERAELHLDAEDILGEFLFRITHMIKNGKYKHEGKIENWLGHHWGNYYWPEVQTDIQSYLDRNKYVNQTDVGGGDDDENYEHQNHSVAIIDVEEAQVRREDEGYAAPFSRDRIFRQLSKPVQDIVQMLCQGMTQNEIAVNLGISPRQLRRRAKGVEDDSNVVSIDASADYGGYIGDISACAATSENTLADMVEAFENAITVQQLATILQCSRREIYKLVEQKRIPALKVGTMIRLDPGQIAEWLRSKMTIAA